MKLNKENARPKTCEDCGDDFTAGAYAKYCPVCRPLHRQPRRQTWKITGEVAALMRERYDGRVPNRSLDIARQLGWPKHAVKHAARMLGLVVSARASLRKAWTEDEIAILQEWAGVRNAAWIARQLDRPESVVKSKMSRLQISQTVTNGYSLREVCRCFGVDHHVVDHWIEHGWLRLTLEGGDRSRQLSRFSDKELRRFVCNHPLEFRLDKVDQVWFLGLILGLPVLDEQRECQQPVRRAG